MVGAKRVDCLLSSASPTHAKHEEHASDPELDAVDEQNSAGELTQEYDLVAPMLPRKVFALSCH